MSYTVKIVPPSPDYDGPRQTLGTKLYVGDNEVYGIQRIELVGEVNNVWRARIDLMAIPPEIEAEARFFEGEEEITDLSDYSRRWAAKYGSK